MLAPWLELPGATETLEAFSQAAGLDLVAHGTTSDADTIRDTAVAQPLIVAASLLAARELAIPASAVLAGHSVGELAAVAVAGVLDPADAVALVAARGRAMARAAALTPTGMAAVVGGDPDEVAAAIEAAGAYPANVNGGGQVVAAGDAAALERLAAAPPAKARVIPLQVAGAFHTPFMDPALEEFRAATATVTAATPTRPVLSDLDGAPMPADVLARLVQQVVAPVRWDLVQRTLADRGVTAVVELAPGGVLTGLARRSLPGVESVAIKSPDDLAAARDLVTRHVDTPEVQA
jgi:[acyl-carrier-protein] S-malonyltransferase